MAHHRPYALVTGATSGIGRAIAETLATSHSVVATGRAVDGLAQLDALDHVRALALDVTDRPAVLDLAENTPFEVVVNNAGALPAFASFETIDHDAIDTMVAVNLLAPLTISRAVLPGMIDRGGGHLFFVGSTAGHAPFPNAAVYGATKAGLASFAAALRCDLAGTGVRVTEVVPGRVETDLYRDALDERNRDAMYTAFDPVQPADVASMVEAVLALPSNVDVTRFDILPTDQFVGGGGHAGEAR